MKRNKLKDSSTPSLSSKFNSMDRLQSKENNPQTLSVHKGCIVSDWDKLHPPTRPSESVINHISDKLIPRSRVLILGLTPEYRNLCRKKQCEVTIVDSSVEMHKNMPNLLDITNNETFIHEKYQNLKFNKVFDFVLANDSLNTVSFDELHGILNNINKFLAFDGQFIIHLYYKIKTCFINPEEIVENYRQKINRYFYRNTFLDFMNLLCNTNGKINCSQIIEVGRNLLDKKLINDEEFIDLLTNIDNINHDIFCHHEYKFKNMCQKYFILEEEFIPIDYVKSQFHPILYFKKREAAKHSKRQVINLDALRWLHECKSFNGYSILSGPPDIRNFYDIGGTSYTEWLGTVTKEIIKKLDDTAVAIFAITDCIYKNEYISKSKIIMEAITQIGGKILWHKMAPKEEGSAFFNDYIHVICFASPEYKGNLELYLEDVLEYGKILWDNGVGVELASTLCNYLKKMGTKGIIDPFCGIGTNLAAANEVGLDCIGVEYNPELFRKAQILQRENLEAGVRLL